MRNRTRDGDTERQKERRERGGRKEKRGVKGRDEERESNNEGAKWIDNGR